jgi:hypothetical protein
LVDDELLPDGFAFPHAALRHAAQFAGSIDLLPRPLQGAGDG